MRSTQRHREAMKLTHIYMASVFVGVSFESGQTPEPCHHYQAFFSTNQRRARATKSEARGLADLAWESDIRDTGNSDQIVAGSGLI